jgi:UrcA family protein
MIRAALSIVCITVLTVLGIGLASAGEMEQSPAMSMEVDASRHGYDFEVRTKVVRFADLNLSHEEGIKVLYRRLHKAAEYVCDQGTDSWYWQVSLERRTCRDTAIANAIAQINNPLISQYHARLTSDRGRSTALRPSTLRYADGT